MRREIAIVEDEPVLQANYRDVLERHGYSVATYSTRKQAMTAFHSRLPELAICLLYTSPSPRDRTRSRMPSSA